MEKRGLIGKLNKDHPVVIYCNEETWKPGQFLFKCCEGCKHNPPKGKQKERLEKLCL